MVPLDLEQPRDAAAGRLARPRVELRRASATGSARWSAPSSTIPCRSASVIARSVSSSTRSPVARPRFKASGESSQRILPWSRIATRSQRKSASSIACVVRMMASSGSCAFNSPNMSQIARRLCGSRPVVGSSRKRTRGECRTPRAISSRRRMPPESWRAIWLRRSQRPTWRRRCSMRSRSMRPDRPYIFPWTERFSPTVRFSSVVCACETVPIDRRTADRSGTTSWPSMRAAAGGRRQQRRQHPDERRLAGAVGTEQAVDLAGLHGERHARRRRRSRRSVWSAARPRWAGASSRFRRPAARFDDEGLARTRPSRRAAGGAPKTSADRGSGGPSSCASRTPSAA